MPGPGVRFRIPPPRRTLLERERLVDALPRDPGRLPRLVLLAAPAGFGKTTLLVQWLTLLRSSADQPAIAWLSVDSNDVEPRHLVSDLVTAVAHATEGAVGPRTRAAIDSDAGSDAEALLASLVTEIDEHAGPLVIALDDGHLADSVQSQEALSFLIDHLPPRTALVMTTRADPQLPLARLRARGELLEIRAADLRFTGSEAHRFLTEIMDLTLDQHHVDALESRTEGWPAGLQLAALAARGRTASPATLDAFIEDFSGSHRFVLDYLVDEVLAAVDGDTRGFLLRTCVLERLTGPLCDAVTGGTDAALTLTSLERRHLFVVPLDDDRRWFRYHHLFADALRVRLRSETPDDVADLHRRAATWYAAQGLLPEATRHAREARDEPLTAYLVEAAIPILRRERRDQAIIDLVRPLSEDVVSGSPLLATTRAWTHLVAGEIPQMDAWLSAAENATVPTGVADLPALPAGLETERRTELRLVPSTVAIYRAALAQAAGDIPAILRHATQAAAMAEPQDHLAHASAAGFLGLADWLSGELRDARTRFDETRTRLEAAGNIADALATTVPIGAMLVGLGRPDRARALFEHDLGIAEQHPASPLASQADLHVGLAGILRELGEFASAAAHLASAQDLGPSASLPENRFRWYAVAADLKASTGDYPAALEELARAQDLFRPGFLPDVQPLAAQRARLLVRLGRLDEAHGWATEHGLRSDEPVAFQREYELITWARVLLAEGRTRVTEALDLLDRVLDDAQEAGRHGTVVDALVARALAHAALEHRDAAVADVSRAVTTGVPAGYRRIFLDEGAPMQELLRAVPREPGAPAAEATRLLLDSTPTRSAGPSGPGPVAGGEPLTRRELDVLRLLDSELTGPEIAAHLFVSLNTLRTHTKHIFTKLDVTTRRGAVRRAVDLGLI